MGLVLGVDASVGMLLAAQQAAPSAQVAVCDAAALPLVDGAASVVIAANMLYHVPEPAAAVSEFRRVLRPGGRVLVVLNVPPYELRQAVQEARRACGLPEHAFGERVGLAKGEEILAELFSSVVRHDFEASLVLDSLEPLEAYIRSMIDTALVSEQVREEYVQRALGCFSGRRGTVTIRTHPGCLVCS